MVLSNQISPIEINHLELEMKGPVCTGSARDVTLPDFDGERIKCDLCGEYDISGTIVFRLSTFNIEERKEALSKAKRIVTNGNRPCIETRCN